VIDAKRIEMEYKKPKYSYHYKIIDIQVSNSFKSGNVTTSIIK